MKTNNLKKALKLLQYTNTSMKERLMCLWQWVIDIDLTVYYVTQNDIMWYIFYKHNYVHNMQVVYQESCKQVTGDWVR